MNYKDYQKEIQIKYGSHFAEIIDLLFTKTTEFAKKGKFDDAIQLANDILVFARYSNVDYALLYILGMICQLYIDNNQPELSDIFFKRAIKLIKESDINYNKDINNLLDLKIMIEKIKE